MKEDINNYPAATSINQMSTRKIRMTIDYNYGYLHSVIFEMLGCPILHSSQTIIAIRKGRKNGALLNAIIYCQTK